MSAQRRHLHSEGIKHLQEGRYLEAQKVLEKALTEFGSHVAVRSDLVFTAYLQGDFGAFRIFTNSLEHEFQNVCSKLSPKSRRLTHISLAKFCEELGRVHEALEHLAEAERNTSPGDSDFFLIAAQKLRLLASYGREDELAPAYRDCLQASERDPQSLIECGHALLLAEARLLGWNAACARLDWLRQRNDLQAADIRLCGFDLLEIALERRDTPARNLTLDFLGRIEVADPYEKELLQLARGCPGKSEVELLEWSRTLPIMAQLRLLALECRREGGSQEAARARLVLLLESLDYRSRAFLTRKWQASLSAGHTTQKEMVVDESARSISCHGNFLHFGARAKPWELLRLFAQAEKVSPEDALGMLHRRDSEFERESLRIALLRLNKKLAPLVGLPWVLRYGKQQIEINPKCKILIRSKSP